MLTRPGAPKHNAFTKLVCFHWKCRAKIGWTRTQQRNKFKRYKKPGIPRLRYLQQDSLKAVGPQSLPAAKDTTIIATSQPAPKDTTISFVFDEVLFDTNSSELKDSFVKSLDSLSSVIKKYENYGIHIVGHTDNSGSERSNTTLSRDRAQAAARHLASTGIDRNVITAEGRGSKDPIADNSTPEGRRKNRRVEIYLTFD